MSPNEINDQINNMMQNEIQEKQNRSYTHIHTPESKRRKKSSTVMIIPTPKNLNLKMVTD
jgi:hypothetical protein